jgi:succinate dehydrogenase/fumarate reductase flavoprotein subunit
LNPPAIDLYKEHGIDLASEPLQIAVCAQHNNGGLKANIWWESDLSHLFPVGEVNGSHGVYRPGGSALNSGQVGSYRAAQFISKKYNYPPMDIESLLKEAGGIISGTLNLASEWINSGDPEKIKTYLLEIRKRMSSAGGIIRDEGKIARAFSEATSLLKKLPEIIGARSVTDLSGSFLVLDHCITHFVYLAAIRLYVENGGRSRGSYIVVKNVDKEIPESNRTVFEPELCVYDRDVEKKIIEVVFKEGKSISNLADVREIPKQDLWFEKVRKDYLEDNFTVS